MFGAYPQQRHGAKWTMSALQSGMQFTHGSRDFATLRWFTTTSPTVYTRRKVPIISAMAALPGDTNKYIQCHACEASRAHDVRDYG